MAQKWESTQFSVAGSQFSVVAISLIFDSWTACRRHHTVHAQVLHHLSVVKRDDVGMLRSSKADAEILRWVPSLREGTASSR
jgi:hypothetical protein